METCGEDVGGGRMVFQVEGTACAKALWLFKRARHIKRTGRKIVVLEY